MKNSASDFISVSGGGAILLRYNLFETNGTSGTHPDWIQMLSSNFTNTTILFNTAYEGPTQQGTQGFMVDGTQNSEIGYNTMLAGAGGGGASYLTGMRLTDSTHTGRVHDNYADISNAYGFFYGTPPANVALCGNYNLVTGQLFSSESACPTRITDLSRPAVPAGLVVSTDLPTGRVVFRAPGRAISGISILDACGRLVQKLAEMVWDGRDGSGRPQPAGVYFYQVTINGLIVNGKIVKTL